MGLVYRRQRPRFDHSNAPSPKRDSRDSEDSANSEDSPDSDYTPDIDVEDDTADSVNDIQVIQQRPRRIKPKSNRDVELRIEFRGFTWSATKTISIPNNATYDLITTTIAPEITRLIQPKRLQYLLWCYSDIGTDGAGFRSATRSNLLSDYPGSEEAAMVIMVTAGILRPLVENLMRRDPFVIDRLPEPGLLSKWLRDLAEKAGLKSHQEAQAENQAAATKTKWQPNQDDTTNAKTYRDLVEEIRSGRRRIRTN